jgi:hypothetical protein
VWCVGTADRRLCLFSEIVKRGAGNEWRQGAEFAVEGRRIGRVVRVGTVRKTCEVMADFESLAVRSSHTDPTRRASARTSGSETPGRPVGPGGPKAGR